MRLANKIAIITGGARGIGKATVEVFLNEGAKVIIWDILEEGEVTAKVLQRKGYIVEFQRIDVTNFHEAQAAAADINDRYGRIDILVNNAGIARGGHFSKISSRQWENVIQINMTGVFNCTKAVAIYMKMAGYGRIISTTSMVGLKGNFGQASQSAAKAAIVGMTKTWAKELGRYGITANAVSPGFIKTDMVKTMPRHLVIETTHKIPSKQMGRPKDIAYAYLFLASDEAAYVSGHVLAVNGGLA